MLETVIKPGLVPNQAAFANDAEAVLRLIDNRVHVNSADDNGRTALVNGSYLIFIPFEWM